MGRSLPFNLQEHNGEAMQTVQNRIAHLFCPAIGTHPTIDYSRVVEQAVHSYPGAKDEMTALVYSLKHTQMQVANGRAGLAKIWEHEEAQRYAVAWVDRYVDFLNTEFGPIDYG